MSRALVALATAALTLGVLVPSASAEAPVEQGWWTITNAGPVAAPTPADVPEDGLLVQGGATGPTAIAALVYEFDPAATVDQLVLTLAPDAASTPATTLQLCALTMPALKPAQGGPMAEAPEYDCEREVSAPPADDGKSYSFDAAVLASSGTLAFAILPTTSSDRVVLAKPDESSLVTSSPASSRGDSVGNPTFSGPSGGEPPPSFEGSASGPSAFEGSTGTFDLPDLAPTGPVDVGVDALVPPEVAGEAPVAEPQPVFESTPATLAGSETEEGANVVARLLLLLALATGAGLWTMAGRTPPAGDDSGAATPTATA